MESESTGERNVWREPWGWRKQDFKLRKVHRMSYWGAKWWLGMLLGLISSGKSLLTLAVFKEIVNVWCQWKEEKILIWMGLVFLAVQLPFFFFFIHLAILHWLLPFVRYHARYSLYGGKQEKQDSSPNELTSRRGAKHLTNIKKWLKKTKQNMISGQGKRREDYGRE